MKILVFGSSTPSVDVFLADDSGLPVTGKTYANFPTTYYSVGGPNAKVAMTFASLGSESAAWTSGGLIERSNGWYRIDLPVAAIATKGTNLTLISEGSGLHLYAESMWVSAGAAGYLGPDWSAINAPTTSNNLSSTTFSQGQVVAYTTSQIITSGTASGGTSTTVTISSSLGADGYLVGCIIKIGSEARVITGYVNSTRVITVDRAWVLTPSSGSTYYITAANAPALDSSLSVTVGNLVAIGTAVWATSSRTLSGFGSLVSDIWSNATRTLSGFGFTVDTNPNSTETAIKAKTDNLPNNPTSETNATTNTNSILSTIPGTSSIATAVWTSGTRSLTGFGSLVADIWSSGTRTLTGFGFTVDTNPNSTETSIKAKTDNLPVNPTSETSATANTNSILSAIPSASSYATAVWNYLTSGMTSAGSIGVHLVSFLTGYTPSASAEAIADATASTLLAEGSANKLVVNSDGSVNVGEQSFTIENYITVPPAVAIASQEASVIVCLRGDTLRVALPAAGDISDRIKAVFTAKRTISDDDQHAVLQIIENEGLVRLNGTDAALMGDAVFDVSDSVEGIINLEIYASVTAELDVTDLVWDVQIIRPSGIVSPISGIFTVIADVTRSVI